MGELKAGFSKDLRIDLLRLHEAERQEALYARKLHAQGLTPTEQEKDPEMLRLHQRVVAAAGQVNQWQRRLGGKVLRVTAREVSDWSAARIEGHFHHYFLVKGWTQVGTVRLGSILIVQPPDHPSTRYYLRCEALELVESE